MKKMTIFLMLMLLALSGCGRFGFGSGTAGSGKTKVEKRTVPAFSAVNFSGAYEVEIVAQKEQSLEIEGDDNLLSLVKTEVNGSGVLAVYNDKPFSTKSAIRVRISVPQLDGISSSGASDIVASNVKADEFNIDTSGAGSVKITGETKTLGIEMSGAGEVDAKDLRAENVSVNSSGAANANVYASGDLRVSASGAGNVNYYGDPKNVSEDVSGAASISKK
jgi:Putative auto-transporter adhesin, head GIN domain